MPIVNEREATDRTNALGTPVTRSSEPQAASSAGAAASYGAEGGTGRSIKEQYTVDSVGLMGNSVFLRFLSSLEPQDQSVAIEMRREWLAQQQSQYGGGQREDALDKLGLWGGYNMAGEKAGGPKMPDAVQFSNTPYTFYMYRDARGGKFDGERAYSFLRKLQSNNEERNLGMYNEMVKVAAGVCGSLDKQGQMVPKIPGKGGLLNPNIEDPRLHYAVTILQYNYGGDGTRGYNTWSQYQRTLLETALEEIDEGNFNGMFTDTNSRFDDYQGVSLSDLNVSAEQLGTMANRYNRYLTELYLYMANTLSRAGATLPNDGSGVTEERLASEVQRVTGTESWQASGVSRLESRTLESLQDRFKTWQSYKSAMDRLVAVSSKLRGLKWAQFMVAYCGGENEEGTNKYWPWWEPNQQETEDLYLDAMDILDRWKNMNDNYDEAVANGDVTAVRPKESDLEKEPEPFMEAAVPGANVNHPVTPMPSQRTVEGANGGNASFFR